jgi:hypothetical protein
MFSFPDFVNKMATHRNQPYPNHKHYSTDSIITNDNQSATSMVEPTSMGQYNNGKNDIRLTNLGLCL